MTDVRKYTLIRKKRAQLNESHLKILKFLKMIYGVMLISPIVYSIIAWFWLQSCPSFTASTTNTKVIPLQLHSTDDDLHMICAGIGFTAAIAALIIHRKGTRERFIKRVKHKQEYFMKLMLMTWVLFEICALSGLALGIFSMDMSAMTPFTIIALVGIASHPPSQARMRRMIFN
jgi:hypothetical protein